MEGQLSCDSKPGYYTLRNGILSRYHSQTSTKIRSKLTLSSCSFNKHPTDQLAFLLTPTNKPSRIYRAQSKREASAWRKQLAKYCSTSNTSENSVDVSKIEAPALAVDEQGIILAVNKGLCAFVGHDKSALVGSNVNMLVPKKVAKKHNRLIRGFVQKGEGDLVGKPRRLHIRLADDQEVGCLLILSEMDAGSASSKAFLAIVTPDNVASINVDLSNISSPALTSDTRGRIISTNKSFSDLFGYDQGELVGNDIKILMPEATRAHHDGYLERFRSGNGSGRLIGKPRALIAQRSNGSQIHVLLVLGELYQNGQRLLLATFTYNGESSINLSACSENSMSFSENTLSQSPSTCFSEGSGSPFGLNGTTLKGPFKSAAQQIQDIVSIAVRRELGTLSESIAAQTIPSASSTPSTGCGNVVIEQRLSNGGGSGAIVYSVTVEGWRCAMKELDLSFQNDATIRSFEGEIQMAERIPYHPNICRYLFHDRVADRLRLFMTLYHSTLYDHMQTLKKQSSTFDMRTIVRLLMDVASGLQFLHGHGIIHRDLKSENLFVVNSERGEIQSLAIGDFDQAKEGPAATMVGTPGYIAPEVLLNSGTPYTAAADVWCLGMVLYEMVMLERPYAGQNLMQLTKTMEKGAPKLEANAALQPLEEIYDALTHLDPTQRISLQQLQQKLVTIK